MRTALARSSAGDAAIELLQLLELRPDAFNDLQGVLPKPHDDDTANNLPLSIKVSDAPSDIRPQSNQSKIFHKNRGPIFVDPYHNAFNIRDLLDVTPTPDHILKA